MLLQRLGASTSLRKIAVTMLLEAGADGSVVTEVFLRRASPDERRCSGYSVPGRHLQFAPGRGALVGTL